MLRNDEIRLRHMLDAARTARRLAQGRKRRDLDVDEGLTLSLVKAVEMIGEAANQVREATRKENSSIPWAQIIAMRNRLVHVYFDINLDVLWQTVQQDLPPLIVQLEALVPQEPDKIPELKNNVLSGTRFQIRRVFLKCAYVVRCQESYGESNLSVMLEFLDDCPALI